MKKKYLPPLVELESPMWYNNKESENSELYLANIPNDLSDAGDTDFDSISGELEESFDNT